MKTATAYYLNKEQAIFIAVRSDTPKALKVHVEVVRVYAAWLKGQTYERPQAPDLSDPRVVARLLIEAAGWLSHRTRRI